MENFSDPFDFTNLTEEDFFYYTMAFLIAVMGEENYLNQIKDSPYLVLNYNNYKNLPIKKRLKYETNIFSKYWRVIKWRKAHPTGDC